MNPALSETPRSHVGTRSNARRRTPTTTLRLAPSPVTTQRKRDEGVESADRRCSRPRSMASYASLLTISSSFDLLFRVLFTFPSQYFCAIGLVKIFSFGWDQPPVLGLQSRTTRLEETGTTRPRNRRTGLSPSAARLSRRIPTLARSDARSDIRKLQFDALREERRFQV